MDAFPLTTVSLSRKLKFHQLLVFDFVLKTGSFVRAANAMGLTQPAVTKAIHELEAFLGAPLFERSNRGVSATEFGLMLGRRVKALLAETRYMTEEINAFRAGVAGHVIVGTLIAGAAKLLPRAIAKLREAAPGISVTVREGTSASLFPALSTGDLDIVVGKLPDHDLPLAHAFPLEHKVLFKEHFCVVVGHRHRLASHKQLVLADLLSEDWIFPLEESPSAAAVDKLFHKAGLPIPIPKVRSLSTLNNIGLMIETDMIALMPRAAAQQFVNAGILVVLDLPSSAEFGDVGYSLRAGKDVHPACRSLIDCLTAVSLEASLLN